jgi:tRNA-specific 2-thiouridylase
MARYVVAMSGGIDSSVAAHLLKAQGHEVTGVFMRNGIHAHRGNSRSCCSVEDAYDARRIADQLQIPFYAVNLSEGFRSVIDYFVSEYNQGRTPNPCVLCNRDLKFGKLFEYARAIGAERVATGHYAVADGSGPRPVLRRGRDASKDQTYMLFSIRRELLDRVEFPVGGLEKPRVREIAQQIGFRIADKPDSQEICFVPGNDYRELLRERSPRSIQPGQVKTLDGEVVGDHPGHQFFTVGQRKGLGFGLGRRMYVVDIDPITNTVTLGEETELFRRNVAVSKINWLVDEPAAGARLSVRVKIRHTHEPAPAGITVEADGRATIVFEEPQRMVTPGQGAALYDGDLLLGGGWIDRSWK